MIEPMEERKPKKWRIGVLIVAALVTVVAEVGVATGVIPLGVGEIARRSADMVVEAVGPAETEPSGSY